MPLPSTTTKTTTTTTTGPAFITLRVDYYNTVLTGSPKSTTDTLKCVLNAPPLVSSQTLMHKVTSTYVCGLSSLLHHQLHWFNVSERIEYKIAVMVRRCLENKAPTYLSDHRTLSGHRRQQPTSRISQPASADCPELSAKNIRLSCFLCCEPDCLELTTDCIS